jgi:hypothetical protein
MRNSYLPKLVGVQRGISHMRIANSFRVIGIHILNDNLVLGCGISHFPPSFFGPLAFIVLRRIYFFGLLCQETGYVRDGVSTAVRLV